MMDELVLTNLEWPLLLAKLAAHAQTIAGQEHCRTLPLDMERTAIELHWQQVEPLKELIRAGYKAPIGELPKMEEYFRAASLGQVLNGESLRAIWHLLATVKQIHRFTTDFRGRCSTLDRFHRAIYPLPKLSQAIEKAIGPEGEILDDASPELQRIRRAKLAMRKKIESQIRQLLVDNELEAYIQDKFFTVRAERYVIPMRLDGRGRVKGSIYDTSDSGQTLFIEPSAIAPLNEELLELELSEKLEILRIFRDLSAQVAGEHDILVSDYKCLVELDILSAEAALAYELDAVPVTLSPKPLLRLLEAKHPLVKSPSGETAVANDITLETEQKALIVSGPNAGGKTVVLKTVGILHLMAKAGLLLPTSRASQIYLFENLYLAMGDAQNLTANLSTFSGHLMTLKPILEKATPKDLVLLDELATGTEPQTGSAIAQAILEKLVEEDTITIATTHFDSLKGLAVASPRFRNGSMEFSSRNLKPTYNLILDIPGQSYGIEVAEHMGLPAKVISRARHLRGQVGSSLDSLVETLLAAREDARRETEQLAENRRTMEMQKAHWEKERRALDDLRRDAARKVAEKYQSELDDLRQELQSTIQEYKDGLKQLKQAGQKAAGDYEEGLEKLKGQGQKTMEQLNLEFGRLEEQYKVQEIPGEPCTIDDLEIGSEVFILSLGQQGTVISIQKTPQPNIEVQAGLLKLRPNIDELRLIRRKPPEPAASGKKAGKTGKTATVERINDPGKVAMIIPTPTNSLDVRGLDSERALEQVWQFIDRAVMRGETLLVLIHGTGTLHKVLRTALAKAPYALNFRPGEASEGRDGVTVVSLEQ